MDIGVNGQSHNAMMTENGFFLHSCFILTTKLLKLHTQTPHELRMCPIDVRFKRSKVNVKMN